MADNLPTFICSQCARLLIPGESNPCAVCQRENRLSEQGEIAALRAEIEQLKAENRRLRDSLAEIALMAEAIREKWEAMIK